MRAALAVAGVALVAMVGAIVVVLHTDRDTTPGSVRSCAKDAGAKIVSGTDRLGPIRVDLLAGTLRPEGATLRLKGGDRAAFLRPRDGAYLAAVVADGNLDDPVGSITVAPERMVMVAYALRPEAAALRACVEGLRR